MTKAANVLWIATMLGLAMMVLDPAQVAAAGGRSGTKNVLLSIPSLTADQKNRIAHLTNTVKMQTAPLREQLAAVRKDIARLWAADTVDKPAMSAKQDELVVVLAKIRTLWSDFFAQLHDVLTAPQRTWLAAQRPSLYGSDAGPDLGLAPKECAGGESLPPQHPGP